MSTTFNAKGGETFARISREQYGHEGHAPLIAAANPGLPDPVPAGAVVTVPGPAAAPQNATPAGPAASEDEVALLINGERFRFWSAMSITLELDAMSTVDFTAPFEPSDRAFRDAFRPFSYAPVVVTVAGEPLFTGTMLTPTPSLGPEGAQVSVACYARPGVLDDCTAPASTFPLEFNGLPLSEIAAALCAPFGLAVVFDAQPGPAFERVALDPSANILPFLTGLAKQRSRVMTSTPGGDLQFPAITPPGSPVVRLREGEPPLVSVTPQFSPQEYYSHVTGLESVTLGTSGSQFTVKNARLLGVVRPLTFGGPDVEGGDIKVATQAKAGQMFANMVSYVIAVPTWRDPLGRLWAPNTTLVLDAPSAMIYGPYEFLIRRVTLTRDGNAYAAELEIVLPGSFAGEIPERLPWEE